jgi:KipI family sensor histidine kinase inhibitor
MSPGPRVRIREAGDSAVLLELGDGHAARSTIDVALNLRAVQLAQTIRNQRIRGVRDVVPTFRSVAVFFNPLTTDLAELDAALGASGGSTSSEGLGNQVDVPVVYGGDAGPDLADVAAWAGISPDRVVALHAAHAYRVCMLGFLPGFPYMATVDDSIAAPRRATPRTRVPAGSVGIAGRQTGIYPRDSPGGWQIIGRTPLSMFDVERASPALLAPGDTVRFVPTSSSVVSGFSRTPEANTVRLEPDTTDDSGTRWVTVVRPGLQTTIQDSGRWGHQHLGVPVSGPMDPVAHRTANALLGNAADAATLEAAILGPELRFEHQARIAIAGGDLNPMLDGAGVPMHSIAQCSAGSTLRFGDRRSGSRVYIAIDGGISVRSVLGSRATHIMSGMGGFAGRSLQAGDRIPLSEGVSSSSSAVPSSRPRTGVDARLRVMQGPQADYCHPDALDVLQRTHFTISPQSDRMGYRLAGGTLPTRRDAGEMISDATVIGALQVPPSGQPILLMADRQTTGGYPQIAVVITADLSVAAQLAPGDSVRFELCTRSEAIAALREQEGLFVGR